MPTLRVMCGKIGAGKSTLSTRLAQQKTSSSSARIAGWSDCTPKSKRSRALRSANLLIAGRFRGVAGVRELRRRIFLEYGLERFEHVGLHDWQRLDADPGWRPLADQRVHHRHRFRCALVIGPLRTRGFQWTALGDLDRRLQTEIDGRHGDVDVLRAHRRERV